MKYNILIIKDFSRFSRRNSRGLAELDVLRDSKTMTFEVNESRHGSIIRKKKLWIRFMHDNT